MVTLLTQARAAMASIVAALRPPSISRSAAASMIASRARSLRGRPGRAGAALSVEVADMTPAYAIVNVSFIIKGVVSGRAGIGRGLDVASGTHHVLSWVRAWWACSRVGTTS